MAAAASPDWKELIQRGIESEELDYKAAQNWRTLSKAGKAKFARHCMALANTKGGYLVVGVGEDRFGRPAVFTGVTPTQAKSFDRTDVGDFVNRCADPAIDFDIERPVVDGRQFVVFVVRRFVDLPHVCAYTHDKELVQGAFYIRTKDASSRVAYRASEIHAIVQRALRNQRALLGRMLRGILYENRQLSTPDGEQWFREQVRHSRRFFAKLDPAAGAGGIAAEIVSFPGEFSEQRFSHSELRQAVHEAGYTFRQRPFASLSSDAETYTTNVSLRHCGQQQPPVYWQAFQSGLFHHRTHLPITKGKLAYLDLVHYVSEALFFLDQFYSGLGCDEDLITVELVLSETEKVWLSLPPGRGVKQRYVCRIPDIRVQLVRSTADLVSGVTHHAARCVREIGERFNLPAAGHGELEALISHFLARG